MLILSCNLSLVFKVTVCLFSHSFPFLYLFYSHYLQSVHSEYLLFCLSSSFVAFICSLPCLFQSMVFPKLYPFHVLLLSHFFSSMFPLFVCVHFTLCLLLSSCPQALLVRALLEYTQSSESCVPYGLSLVAGIFLLELMRSWSLALMWAVNYRTAARLRGAALTFAFHKILRLRSTKDISPGEVGGITLEGTHL